MLVQFLSLTYRLLKLKYKHITVKKEDNEMETVKIFILTLPVNRINSS